MPDPPPHLSAYLLTVEPGTPLAGSPDRHPVDDVQADRYETADRVLTEAGYRWEEISNWARDGHELPPQPPLLGAGRVPRASGRPPIPTVAGRRWWNVRTPDRYVSLVAADRPTTAGEEVLDDARRRVEALALSLRTPAGVPSGALSDDPDLDGLVDRVDGRAVLTLRGRLLANAVTARLRDPAGAIAPVGGPGAPGTMPLYA